MRRLFPIHETIPAIQGEEADKSNAESLQNVSPFISVYRTLLTLPSLFKERNRADAKRHKHSPSLPAKLYINIAFLWTQTVGPFDRRIES